MDNSAERRKFFASRNTYGCRTKLPSKGAQLKEKNGSTIASSSTTPDQGRREFNLPRGAGRTTNSGIAEQDEITIMSRKTLSQSRMEQDKIAEQAAVSSHSRCCGWAMSSLRIRALGL